MKLNHLGLILSGMLLSANVQANLLTNSGFESGFSNWQTTGNAQIRTLDPLAYEGSNYVFGSNTASFTVRQDVDLVLGGLSTSDIDSGLIALRFGGWQSGWNSQQDYGRISLYLFDSAMNQLASASLPSFFSNHTWVEQTGSTGMISGTRFARYEFVGTRVEGSNNDAYLDAASLEVASVPLPSSLLLLGSGFLGLACMRARRQFI